MAKRNIHVVPSSGQWSVRKEGATRATGVYSTKKDAVVAAREVAKRAGASDLVVHNKDGTVLSRDTVPVRDKTKS